MPKKDKKVKKSRPAATPGEGVVISAEAWQSVVDAQAKLKILTEGLELSSVYSATLDSKSVRLRVRELLDQLEFATSCVSPAVA